MKGFISLIYKINELFKWIIGSAIVLLGFLIFYTVIMRYIFSKPPIWSFDLSGWLTGMIVFLGGGYALLSDSHVKVDLFYEKFPQKLKSVVDIITYLVVIGLAAIFIWKGMDQVIANFQSGTVAQSGFNIYMWIKWAIVPFGALLLGLQAFVQMIERIYFLIKNEELLKKGEA
ncbi:TRAP transporter small permease subunit [Bacillus norwichensis]|uniref:TRAP transporter small permease n=1 Tax=Bacillus norwichensis TaxID=2762217 RepID=A0ABR8VPY4_9BACI|nr:TRAP transporter small permease [Bacillus norwichensis]MBD8006823.1 TRAP transporter small permease [Bacillus norwichensis]